MFFVQMNKYYVLRHQNKILSIWCRLVTIYQRAKTMGAVLEFHTVFEVQPVPVENTGFRFQGNITSPMEMYPQCIPRNSSSLVGLCSVFRRCAAGRPNPESIGISSKTGNIKGPGNCLPGPKNGADGGGVCCGQGRLRAAARFSILDLAGSG